QEKKRRWAFGGGRSTKTRASARRCGSSSRTPRPGNRSPKTVSQDSPKAAMLRAHVRSDDLPRVARFPPSEGRPTERRSRRDLCRFRPVRESLDRQRESRMNKPRIFLGSSGKQAKLLEAIT